MATASNTSTKRYKELGNSGVQIFNGIITGEEYNFNLMGRNALKTWDEMRRSDAAIKMSLKVVKEPVKSLTWHVQPATNEEKDVEIAEYISANFFDVLRWKTTLHEILTHLEFGFSVFEKVLAYGPINGANRIFLERLAFRKQTSIAKWVAGDEKPGVSQYGKGGDIISIPLDKIVVFTHEQEGDNYEGMSILRPAYKHWYYKEKLYQIDAIGHERQSLGVVKIKHPKNAKPSQIEQAEVAARNLRANEEASIREPDGWSLEFMDMKAKSLKDTEPSINHHNRQIVVNVLAGFMDLGSNSGSGSRSVGETQLKIFEYAIKFIADYIADTMNRYVVKELVDLNYNVTEYPKLTAGEVSGESLTELANALKSLIDAGAIEPTPEDEAYLRGIMGLPERVEDATSNEEDEEPSDEDTKEGEPIGDKPADEKKEAAVIKKAKAVLAAIKKRLHGKSGRAS